MPQGTVRRTSARSRCRHNCCKVAPSITINKGSMMAAAWGTGITRAIIGVASEPKPLANPLLLKPTSSTAGKATA